VNRPDRIARRLMRAPWPVRPTSQIGLRVGLALALLVVGCDSLQNAIAEGDTRSITMHHLHTGEDITITYKRNGIYDDAALKRLDWFLRDWRENRSIHMDPHLIDLVWEVNREVEGTQPIQIVCGYRDESTNSMLRRRSTGVAQHSQHVLGKAMDFYIPGVALEKIRVAGLRLQRGGVGFYPTSGSPFVHLDVGGVRHWPRMTREQLVRVFPNGRTVHIPSDGRPLSGYALALADIQHRGGRPSSVSLAQAEQAGAIDASDTTASARKPSLLAAIFGSHESEPETTATTTPVATPVAKPAAPMRVALAPVPQPKTRPMRVPMTVVASIPAQTPAALHARAVVAAASRTPADIINSRGYWVGVPDMHPARGVVLASATTASMPREFQHAPTPKLALAYAAVPPSYSQPQRHSVVTRWAGAATSIAGKAKAEPARTAAKAFDPWLNAVTITPSVRQYLSATQYGARDFRSLQPLLDKPATTVAMTFTADPTQGLSTERFSGRAIVFIGTTTFAAGAGTEFLKTAFLP
jgi:uncharacterized protein YcbK (DUF882 family)